MLVGTNIPEHIAKSIQDRDSHAETQLSTTGWRSPIIDGLEELTTMLRYESSLEADAYGKISGKSIIACASGGRHRRCDLFRRWMARVPRPGKGRRRQLRSSGQARLQRAGDAIQ